MQQHGHTTVAGTGFGAANVQQAGVDLPQGATCGVMVVASTIRLSA
jgi:ribosomal protein L13E